MARKILLADDSVTAQNMGRKILTDAGYEVITVNNGSSALKKITETKPDLIVLDVYMPGYSGLEVCQRVKEAQDTAHIPVLLTVGKLEPFKQEEARRARADAFIIKPFEATELLSAVGKLQDKLGAVPLPPSLAKEGRFASATMASFERVMSESAPKFGDQDSGWKVRLKIPAPGAKQPDAEPEPATPPSRSAFRDLEEPPAPPAPKIASVLPERPIPAGIPQDITPDEIAAITAAAARVNVGMSVGKEFERFRKDSPRPELIVSTQKDESAPKREKPAENAAEVVAEKEVDAKAPAPEVRPDAVVPMPPAPAPVVVPEAVATQTQAAEQPKSEKKILEPALVAAGAVAEPATMAIAGRWIAEEIALNPGESVLVLEREMHKAFAAFAAAEYAAIPPDLRGAVDKDDEPIFATMAPPAIGSPVPVEEETGAEETEKRTDSTPVSGADTAVPQLVVKPPAAPFAPAALKVDEEQHAVAAFGGPDPFGKPEAKTDETTKPEAESVSSLDPAKSPVDGPARQPEFSVTPAGQSDDSREPAKSAAEKVVADALKQIEQPTTTTDEKKPEAAMAAAASADGSSSAVDASLSNLVDSMLAELKPKLMAELAKKLDHKKE